MVIQDWNKSINKLIQQLYDIDFGYPLGENKVLAAQSAAGFAQAFDHPILKPFGVLREFYASNDGLSFPDVHVGYFIKPVSRLTVIDPESEPTEILGPYAGKVLVVGSTGGGGLFALHKDSLNILYLPPGPLHAGVYDGTRAAVEVVAASFNAFLDRIRGDLNAFVNNTPNHRFLV